MGIARGLCVLGVWEDKEWAICGGSLGLKGGKGDEEGKGKV